jgi:hypothetical protein
LVEEWYDQGVIICEAGPGAKVFMRTCDPYYDAQMRPVSERDASRAGFNVAYWRHERRALEIQTAAKAHADKIKAEGAKHLKTAEQAQEERTQTLRAAAAKAIRVVEKRAQAAADKMITRDLDKEALPRA